MQARSKAQKNKNISSPMSILYEQGEACKAYQTFSNVNDSTEDVNKRAFVPNSNVPDSVVPPDCKKKSTILDNRIVRVGSTTSSDLDKNILYRMKEFELVGQQLFGV